MESLQGWVIIWVHKDADYPSMTSNICDEPMARAMAADMIRLGHARQVISIRSAESLRPALSICPLPPSGWYCTRGAGHSAPCAAHKVY